MWTKLGGVQKTPLAELFCARHPLRLDAEERSMLQARLLAMLEAARLAWPSFSLTREQFVRAVAERVPGAATGELDRLHATDLYLACACAEGDPPAIAELERVHLAPIPKLLARKGTSSDVADEVVQALRERLLVAGPDGARKIAGYDGRGPLAAWLKVAATRAVNNLRRDEENRAQLLRAQGEEGGAQALGALDPELALIQQRYGPAFRGAIADAFAALEGEERTALQLHFQHGMNLDAIARALGLSRATAGRRMLAGRTRVLEETLRLLGERIACTPEELKSLLGVVRSKLEVSLGALLADR